MQPDAMTSSSGNPSIKSRRHRTARYQKVCDARKHPVRGLWIRNDRYYAQITVEESETGLKTVKRVPLEGANTDAQAIEKFEDLKADRRKGAVTIFKLTPKFTEYADEYLNFHELKTSSKRYADSQGENQLDGLIYSYAMDQLGFRTTNAETLIRYDVLVKTKSPAFQQIYFNKSPQDYGRLTRWIQEVLQAIDRESFFPNFGWACHNCQFRSRCWSM